MSELHKFIFEGLPVRGAIVRLDGAWREMLARRAANTTTGAYPVPVRELLGEMAAAGVLMQSSIKFNGALVLQIFGDGPLRLAVAEVQSDLSLRATAALTSEVPDGATLPALVNVAGGGRCAITLDPKDKFPGQQPYQGVVPLHGDRREKLEKLSQVLEHYMLQSEQLDTTLVLAAFFLQQRRNNQRLTLALAGTPHRGASELLASEAMTRLLEEVSSRYRDRIVVFEGNRRQIGELMPVTIYDANAHTLFGQVVTQHVGPEVYELAIR